MRNSGWYCCRTRDLTDSAESSSHFQNEYFSANWIILGSLADVTRPKRLLPRSIMGSLKRTEFVRLNASARNSILFDSRIWKVRARAASNCQVDGPRSALLP